MTIERELHSTCSYAMPPQRGQATQRHVPVCRHAPFLIAFEERAQVFQTVISADRSRRREMGAYGPQSFVTIHRDTLMQVTIPPAADAGPSTATQDRACDVLRVGR